MVSRFTFVCLNVFSLVVCIIVFVLKCKPLRACLMDPLAQSCKCIDHKLTDLLRPFHDGALFCNKPPFRKLATSRVLRSSPRGCCCAASLGLRTSIRNSEHSNMAEKSADFIPEVPSGPTLSCILSLNTVPHSQKRTKNDKQPIR